MLAAQSRSSGAPATVSKRGSTSSDFLPAKYSARSLLIGAQHVDAEAARRLHHRMGVRALGDRDDAERRIERSRHEGVGRHAVR